MFAASKTDSASTGGYQISRSLRFNSADSANLNRTPSVAANQQIWTFSIWLKRSRIGADYEGIFSSGNGTDQIRFENNDVFRFGLNGSSSADFLTTQVFRDVSAWYHIVVAVDTTQATSTNRVKIYVNGTQVTSFSTANYPSQNYNTSFNNTADHRIGSANTSAYYFNGYMTEFNWIGGQQLTPSSFGETNADTGVWQPKAYSGSYGTNGFYLNFSDNSNTTAATLGKDYSGNGNNWTPNGFSISSGAGNDSLVDSPTSYGTDTGVGGTVRGNYCTLNPLFIPKSGGVIAAFSNGNLDANTNNSKVAFGTMQIPSTGKWYFEFTSNTFQYASYGIGTASALGGGYADAMFGFYQQGSNLQFNIGNNSATGTSSGIVSQAGDIALVCVDMDNGKIWMGRDRSGTVTWSGGGTPAVSSPTWSAAGQGGVWSTNFDTTSGWFPLVSSAGTDTWSCNFGQRPFAYTAPSGFKALCTQNLPTPTIGATTATLANKYFDISLWTGNGTSQTLTNSGGFQPDWVWTKGRSNADSNVLVNAVTGANQFLVSDSTQAEATSAALVSAFTSSGFSIGSSTSINRSSSTYVGWQWKANGSGSTNTAGSITSTVSANTTSGFSVVTYTGTGANATVGHGLGVAPAMVIYKNRTSASSWIVYHTSISPTNLLVLSNGDAQQSGTAMFNSTAATSSLLSIGSNSDINGSAANYVAYCFAPIVGYSAFGSYTGNGSTDGPFVFTGMRPAYLMIKRSSASENWYIFDVARGTYNVIGPYLQANLASAESTGTIVDFLSNGFKIRESGAGTNTSASTYIYMAFAENPFKYSLAR